MVELMMLIGLVLTVMAYEAEHVPFFMLGLIIFSLGAAFMVERWRQ